MKSPNVLSSNIVKVYKTLWFVTDTEIADLKQTFVFCNQPVSSGDLYQGLYFGIAREDFDNFIKGGKKYKAIAICNELMQKIHNS